LNLQTRALTQHVIHVHAQVVQLLTRVEELEADLGSTREQVTELLWVFGCVCVCASANVTLQPFLFRTLQSREYDGMNVEWRIR